MKYILLKLLAYDCGQEYELDDYSVLLETTERGNGDDEQARNIISDYLKGFYEIDELPVSVIDDIEGYKLSDESVSIFDVDCEYHNLEYMEMVHIEVEWQYIDVYKGGVMINVGDIFISKECNTKLRVISYTGEGFDQNCYCLLETDDDCWNGYHSALHIEKCYTKLERL